jgi:two-component system, LytTR family, response regulator LytT
MNILIIEDEELAVERLSRIVSELQPGARIIDSIASVKSAVEWFGSNPQPDLVLMDINLADGSSFEIFKKAKVTAPVIFITAFDQYAIDAFKVNSIDYLLKPVKKEELKNALEKYKSTKNMQGDVSRVIEQLMAGKKEYQKRIIIRFGENIKMIEVKDVAYFYTEDKVN